ncbi:MAG: ATP-binding cassette domain-containing protein, partial [Burkholderiaceae bacterium]|nr:ATP-binding cassette domain-containing protein [Burkholderiaceae bacterium]
MSALLLELNHPGLKLGGRQVLAPCQLSVHAGERLALIGANGAGKTSLLRLLHGLLPAEGRVLHQMPGLGRLPRQAMVFQQPFFLRMSVQRNLRLALWLAGVPAEERADRTQAALQRVGLQALAGRDACS